ncbi:tripartite tricarboxylate transporter substrate binding protein [Methylocella sp. CPCC 101449]|jgi:tripartite-type tricarboxylate transporter receptor subunit TctC|uniref:Bug family tripartite tricarboxylate transporter substrate binding protein n=1 Tax=Methylocella sp. CPCC 101449 TaxID=2987531 RepID=UPI00288F6C39|nr:tripartite tricarboxylate transporter substrate binding protein [Methylocella sp. CPCC 101449]MDT2023284.1 tripartite tricarboxylate transporter substrate binding protein [Methylocella sp. CPCC 101449]HEV2574180.1 tripartite tricarboxylate transporter substrate binding protein [Beijerinckiaceae bacterium]
MPIKFLHILASLALAVGCMPVAAQTYPDRPVRIIVPSSPGGGFDVVGRVLAERLQRIYGQGFVVENRTGAGTLVGTEAVLQSPADGYTLLVGGLSNMALNSGLYAKIAYNPVKDFTPLGLVVSWSYTLISRKDAPYKDLHGMIDYARANPDKVTVAYGKGSGQHIAIATLENATGVKFLYVPYRGAQPAYQDLLTGRIDLYFDNSQTAMPHVEGKAVIPLAVSSRMRQAFHPDVPTVAETGLAPMDMETWFGLYAPAATPKATVESLRASVAKIAVDPEVMALFRQIGGRPLQMTPQETETFVRNELERWTKLLKTIGVTAD